VEHHGDYQYILLAISGTMVAKEIQCKLCKMFLEKIAKITTF
jgi:hypothetical protein